MISAPYQGSLSSSQRRIAGSVEHQAVGERVGELAEARLDLPAASEEAVQLVGDPRDEEDPAGCPARAVVGCAEEDDREERHQREPQHGQRVRDLRERGRTAREAMAAG